MNTGAAFEHQVIDLARILGWRTAHFRAARTAAGWATPVAGDGKGFPDLVLVRDRVVFAELKTGARPRLGPDQVAWRDALAHAGAEWHLWAPAALTDGTIARVLRARTTAHRPTGGHP